MIVGHEAEIKHLKRLADNRGLAHGYIFFGPPRVGKRTVALALAHYLESGEFSEPKLLQDALEVRPSEEGSVGIDQIREIRNFVFQKPNISPHRTVIVGDGELLTPEAQNALLKITEEPPPSALLILVIDDPERLLPTVQSRLQKLHFAAVSMERIAAWLVEKGLAKSPEALKIAKLSHGEVGLAYAWLTDKKFQKNLKSAEKFFKTSARERRDFVKELVAAESFDLNQFLEALMLVSLPVTKGNFPLWRRLLNIKRQAGFFNLNPRLQLTALAEALR